MKKVLKILEFDRILERMQGYTESEPVRKRISRLEPYTTVKAAQAAQKETTEAMSTLLKLGSPPLTLSVPDVRPCVKRSEQGGILTVRELLEASRVLRTARSMKGYLADAADECTVLHGIGDTILTAKAAEDRINSCIVSEEEIADGASGELAAIRRRMRGLNARIRETLNGMIHSPHYKKYLQDFIVTMRSDRYVVPVRAEFKSEVPGIVHDTSATGQTVFIEPMSVVNANNEIRDLRGMEQREIERILAELSALVAENATELTVDYKALSGLDFIFCKGRLSLDMGATEPRLNGKGIISLKRARHPLIDRAKVVANDIEFGKAADTLVVTGPNTGGKTVTLKTVGLLSVMAAAGLHITAGDNSDAAVFSRIFADIGDEQSIEQSLSTFSSHMTNIVKILKNVDSNSLALFDELGAGTDPTEGAALAIAILEQLRALGAKTLATTHYSELKIFALTTDGVENASCEFDVNTLQPTYRLLIGVPGKSNAFAISRRLGLSKAVIDRANDILSDEDIKFEDVITDLQAARDSARRDADETERLKRELKELRRSVEADRIKLKDSKARILDEARREAKIIVMDAKDEANGIIRELEAMRQRGIQAEEELNSKTGRARERLKKREDSIDRHIKGEKPRRTLAAVPKDLKAGELVKIIDIDQEATVIRPPDKSGKARVEAGIIKLDVHISNLARLDKDAARQKAMAEKFVPKRSFESKSKTVSTELDVRGEYPDEAWMHAEKFLDDCYLAGISPARIVHGKGTGVLKKYIRDMLRGYRYVKSFRPGAFGEGDEGVTVVELKV